MFETIEKALSVSIKEHINLYKTRQETLIWLVILILRHGTVNIWRLAPHAQTRTKILSVHRRFERFFQHVQLDKQCMARLSVHIMGLAGKPWHLALDRTNWKIGKKHINILLLGIVVNKICVPLFWVALNKAGNSSTYERTTLLSWLHKTFPDQPIASLSADREFVGEEWMNWLIQNKIPFVLRLKENMYIHNKNYVPMQLSHHARGLKIGEKRVLRGTWYMGQDQKMPLVPVHITLIQLENKEMLILASYGMPPKQAEKIYRKRWSIETLFSCLKSKGLGLEDTHMHAPQKIETLLGVLAIVFVLAYKAGLWEQTNNPPKIKAHGYPQQSIFTLGLNIIRKTLAIFQENKVFFYFRALASPKMRNCSLTINRL